MAEPKVRIRWISWTHVSVSFAFGVRSFLQKKVEKLPPPPTVTFCKNSLYPLPTNGLPLLHLLPVL